MATRTSATILFDGTCNLCSSSVRFVRANDPHDRFNFEPLHSPQAAALLATFGRGGDAPASIVLVQDGRLFERSDAALRIAADLRFPWALARALLALPARFRDPLYDWIARNRYRFFGRRETAPGETLPRATFPDATLRGPSFPDASLPSPTSPGATVPGEAG
jgi:predicted DCC family thiol-disulfide oxidoreductase YuxK